MSDEALVERVAKKVHAIEGKAVDAIVEWDSMPEEHREMYRDDARAVLLEVADAVEGAERIPGDGGYHHKPGFWASAWIREQAAEEGASDG